MSAVLKQNPSQSRRELVHARARDLQLELWNSRGALWTNGSEMSPIDVLQPGVAIELQGFKIRSADFIGNIWDRGRYTEVAGELDRTKKMVLISSRYSQEVQNFTAAHELAHLLLHPELDVMHRDLPLDGPGQEISAEEREANWFASEFLMPEKRVRKEFEDRFGRGQFQLTDDTAFALCQASLANVLQRCRLTRDVSLLLTKANMFNGVSFLPLHKKFKVSVKAMAIRIDQLGLTHSPNW